MNLVVTNLFVPRLEKRMNSFTTRLFRTVRAVGGSPQSHSGQAESHLLIAPLMGTFAGKSQDTRLRSQRTAMPERSNPTGCAALRIKPVEQNRYSQSANLPRTMGIVKGDLDEGPHGAWIKDWGTQTEFVPSTIVGLRGTQQAISNHGPRDFIMPCGHFVTFPPLFIPILYSRAQDINYATFTKQQKEREWSRESLEPC